MSKANTPRPVRTSAALPIVAAALLLGGPVAAEQATGGTAVIRGRVIAADTGEPIHGAVVQVGTVRLVRNDAARVAAERGWRTDDRGVYEITGIPGGRYLLVAFPPGDKAMYLRSDRLASNVPAIVDLQDGEVLTGVDFALPRASAISGRVVDDYGRPLAGMAVNVLTLSLGGALSRPSVPSASSLSDDLGRYRAWGLQPGDYYVSVEPGTRTAGYPRGPGGETYVRTFYPDMTSFSAATAVTLRTSEDLANVDVRVAWSRAFSVTGTVLGEAGRPAPMTEVRLDGAERLDLSGGQRAMTDLDGRFAFTRLTPGDYVLGAHAIGAPAGAPLVGGPLRLTIGGADIGGLTLVLHPGVTLSGVVVTETGSPPPFSPDGIRVRASAADLTGTALIPRAPVGVRADWTFEVPGILVPVTLLLQGLPKGWFTKAVLHGVDDVTSTPTDFNTLGNAGALRLVVSDRGATLAGTVLDRSGRPAARRGVWLVPERAVVTGGSTAGSRTALTDENGRFEIAVVPPGRYAAFAADSPADVLPNDDTLAAAAALGTRVTLNAGEFKQISLRLVAWPY